jgi:hypothetical protein
MTWGRFERYALEGFDDWREYLFWPHFLLMLAYLVAAPIHDAVSRWRYERSQAKKSSV